MLSFRHAAFEDAALIAPLLRIEDILEIKKMGQFSVEKALRHSIEQSFGGMTGIFFHDNRPIALFGVAPFLDMGVPWLVGTPDITYHQKTFLRETRFWVRQWQKHYSHLTNIVDADYGAAIRWLTWLGFTINPPEPLGLDGRLFCRFTLKGTR